ncbi:MAG: ANTAR domain-containing response regulator [Ruminococcus sp.]
MNSSIVIALPKIDDAKKIRTILNRHGFSVAAVCSTASTALASMSELDGGILICGYKLTDRYYRDVLEDIPSYFEMLLLASGRVIAEAPTSVLTVEMPMKASDLINTVNMILMQQERKRRKEKKKPKLRSEKEQNYISNAKMMLMQRNHLSEDDAYRYIQKSSMDSGTNMVETAQMLLMLLYDEV